jgi:hypothetical protein
VLGVAGCGASSGSNDGGGTSCPIPCAVGAGSGGALGSGGGSPIASGGSGGSSAIGVLHGTGGSSAAPGGISGSGGTHSVPLPPGGATGGVGGIMMMATGGMGGGAGMMPMGGATGGMGGGGMPMPGGGGDCGTVPATDDYAASGPFGDGTMMDGSGPDGMYTIIKPGMMGMNGFKHPIITWGNGITTTPQLYPGLLQGIASHGFMIIASDSSSVTSQMMLDGLDWMIKQNDAGGMFEGQLNTKCLATVGYSLGGGAAVDSGSHENVRATVSFHGLQGASENDQGPLLLFTTTADGFVTKDSYVKPCYDRSTKVPTIMATLKIAGYDSPNGGTSASADFSGHLYPIGDAGDERAPGIAWLRLWIYGDEGAKKYFYGDDCILCKDPWTDIQRKNATW